MNELINYEVSTMKFWLGLYGMQSPRSYPRSLAWTYSEVVRHAIEAEKLGFDGFGVTEHHFWYDGYCPSLLPVLAAIARRTSKIELLTGALLLPLRDPLRVAQEAAIVDQLSRGRLTLAMGYGYRPEEYEGLGLEMKARGPRFSEGVEVLRLALAGDRFSFDGRYYRYQDVSLSPAAYTRPYPPMWLAGGSQPVTAERAGRLGVSYLAPAPALPLEHVRQLIQAYRKAWIEAGHPPEQSRVAVATDVALADTAEQAEQIVNEDLLPVYAEQLAGFGFVKDEQGAPVREIPDGHPIFQMLRDSFCIGTPGQVIEAIERYRALGCDVFIPRMVEANCRSERILGEMRLFAETVMPHFQEGTRS
jgi:alkanesulfonate monooxygenase SsuD/methylene tetrahydromethanopterin reductase-like flavin-dependent oxidoreductase (luciferase family)